MNRRIIMKRNYDWFNSSLYLLLAIIVRFAEVLSALGAGYIILDIVKDADRRKPTRNVIMLFMSTCDYLFQFRYWSCHGWTWVCIAFQEQRAINGRVMYRDLSYMQAESHRAFTTYP